MISIQRLCQDLTAHKIRENIQKYVNRFVDYFFSKPIDIFCIIWYTIFNDRYTTTRHPLCSVGFRDWVNQSNSSGNAGSSDHTMHYIKKK